MKKLFAFIFICVAYIMAANAQRVTTQVSKTAALSTIGYYQTYSGLATDTVGGTRQTWSYNLNLNKDTRTFYNVKVYLQEQAGTAKDSVILQGKIMDDDSWTNITTVLYNGAGTDTTVLFTQNSTAIFYRYLRVYVGSTSAVQRTKIAKVQIRLVK